jgi:hypothetical protein
MLATLLICFYGSEAMLPNMRQAPRLIDERWRENLRQLLNLPKVKSAFDQRLADQSRLHALPLTRHEVGRHTIDLFGFEHGLIPLNGMTYHPRPMGGGAFNVYTPALMQLNRDFLHDPTRRPDYYLLRIQTVDDRLPTQDDGLALTDLLYRYQPILVEHDHLLLKALAQPVSPIPRLLSRQTFKFGDIVPVPAVGSHELLFARFDISPNFLGRVLAAFYKLPRVKIGLVGQNIAQPEARRIVPAMAGSPFILGPVIENTRDWLGLFTDQPGKSLSTFRISTRDRTWFRKTIQVEFYAMPRPTAPQQSVINELLPFTETAIEAVSTVLPSGKPDKLIGLLMHPPSKLSWSLKGDERSLSFGYGLVPAAYLEGHTDGVEFIANLQRAGHPSLELFRRLLDPVARKTDQGHHPTEVILPVLPPGTRVVMTVNPGPHGNSAWDWAYISALQFKYGEYPAGQFPGFNVVPVAVETNVNPISEVDGKRFFMLHAPSALTFALKGNEHSLQIDFGLLSGAYTGDGHTEGVDYAVEIVRAGQPTREIFRRDLRPLTVPTDRGQQHADISLPDLKQGDQLILRTSAGPTGSVSWGWAYLERLHLE